MSALRKKTYSDILRPSVAKTKLRAAYSRPPQIAFGGLIAGAGTFLSPFFIYLAGSAAAQRLHIEGPDIAWRMEWLIDYFGIRVVNKSGFEQMLVNFLVVTACFSVIGLISAFIYKISTITEDSTSFFMRRLRFPFEILPFFAILLFNSFGKASDVMLGFIAGILLGLIWKFYYGKMLSFISTVDVGKIIPDIKLK